MGVTAVRLSFKDSGGEIVHCGFELASAAVLVEGRPWRTFRWHRGQAHYSGWYWAATMRRHVVYESRLELARLLLADFDPKVTAIAAQPFFLSAAVDGKERVHVPDFLLVGDDGLVTVVNVKPARRLADPRVAEALGWADAAFAQWGWRHEIWTGAPTVVISNVRFLAGYRNPDRVDAGLLAAMTSTRGPMEVGDIDRAWPDRAGEARAAALHLLWRGMWRADLSAPLSAQTLLERAA